MPKEITNNSFGNTMWKKILTITLVCIVAAIAIAMGAALFWGKTPSICSERINEAKTFAKEKGFNPDYCIFVDFSAYSGSKRFMLYSFKEDKVIYSCKCAYGNDGSEKMEATEQSFSNEKGSHKSSLGKYKIGKKRTMNTIDGTIDISKLKVSCYEMHGLEKTNSNAHSRGILLHPDPTMTNIPTPLLPWHSFGCFSIPYSAFNTISKHIDQSEKPILLWAYYAPS